MRRLILLTLLIALTAGAGCASEKFTRERYETIYLGQPDYDVAEVLGEPDRRGPGRWLYVHDEPPHYSAEIVFDQAGRVIGREWSYELPGEPGY